MSDEKDKKSFFPDGHNGFINFASLGKLQLKNLSEKNRSFSSGLSKKYTKDDIEKFLDSPDRYQKQLRDVSRILYLRSPHYRRTINYFAKMPLFSYIVEPYGIDFDKQNKNTAKVQFKKVNDFLELMNIPHEFLKILVTAFKEDVFYGYEYMTKDSYFIQRLNPDFCQISSIEDGVYNFAFDFSYFDKNPDRLEMYDKEFTKKYNLYKDDKAPAYQELDSERTICIKINEELEYPVPPLAGTFEDIYDIQDYKKLRKSNKQIDNYKILAQKLPMNDKSDEINSFLVDYDTMMKFHNMASHALPEEIGLITNPFEVQAIDFSKGAKDEDNVGDAERDYWSGVGVSQLLFNTDKSSSIGLDKSIKTDEELVFGVLRQIERWLNRRLKHEFTSLKYKITILNVTVFNQKEFFENALKAGQSGLPTKIMACSSLGISPSSMTNLTFLENDVLELHDRLIPLSSSHTQSDKEDGGKKNDSDLSEEGLRTRDEEKNENRND